MDPRRKTLGRRLARARRKAGYKSQRAFAEAIKVSEASVANAERGADSVGDGVFTAIEVGLNLPDEIATKYIETGDDRLLEAIAFAPNRPEPERQPEPEPDPDDINEEMLEHMLEQTRFVVSLSDAPDADALAYLRQVADFWASVEKDMGRLGRTLDAYRKEAAAITEGQLPDITGGRATPNGA